MSGEHRHEDYEARLAKLEAAARPPAEQPVNDAIRRAALEQLPPDSERDLIEVTDLTTHLPLVSYNRPLAFEMGRVYPAARWNILAWNCITLTVFGDRSKPFPVFDLDGGGPLRLHDCEDVVVEFLEGCGGRSSIFYLTGACKNIHYRYCMAHNGGTVRGDTPDSGNVGGGFLIAPESTASNVIWDHCESWGMAEDGFQAFGSGVMRIACCYSHDHVEDGADQKGGHLHVSNSWLVNNRSKNLVVHNNSIETVVCGSKLVGTTLHDAVYIDGQNPDTEMAKPGLGIQLVSNEIGAAKQYGVVAKRTPRNVELVGTKWVPSLMGNYKSDNGHTGKIVVVP